MRAITIFSYFMRFGSEKPLNGYYGGSANISHNIGGVRCSRQRFNHQFELENVEKSRWNPYYHIEQHWSVKLACGVFHRKIQTTIFHYNELRKVVCRTWNKHYGTSAYSKQQCSSCCQVRLSISIPVRKLIDFSKFQLVENAIEVVFFPRKYVNETM